MSKTIVLIHGYGFDSRIWCPVELAFEGNHVLYLTLPGFGDDPVEGPYTIAELAQKFWTEIDQRMSPEVHLVGHSMGGYVCIEMAAQHPERVVSLSLVHSHVFEDSADKKMARTKTAEEIMSHGRAGFAQKMISSLFADGTGSSEMIGRLVTRGMKYNDKAWAYGALAMRDRADHSKTLENLHVPLLLILGEKDTAVPLSLGLSQASLSEKTTLCLYPTAGHLSMYENTAVVIRDFVRFFNAV
jgi:pimeloyl-ACP methyl ester carboxylesterase